MTDYAHYDKTNEIITELSSFSSFGITTTGQIMLPGVPPEIDGTNYPMDWLKSADPDDLAAMSIFPIKRSEAVVDDGRHTVTRSLTWRESERALIETFDVKSRPRAAMVARAKEVLQAAARDRIQNILGPLQHGELLLAAFAALARVIRQEPLDDDLPTIDDMAYLYYNVQQTKLALSNKLAAVDAMTDKELAAYDPANEKWVV